MSWQKIIRGGGRPAVFMLLALSMGGCLVADALVRIAYDPARDEFRQLIVYERFRARDDRMEQKNNPPYEWDKDFDELSKMWATRDRMILLEPSIQRLFGMIAHAERSHAGALVGGWKPFADEPAVSWKDVTVHP